MSGDLEDEPGPGPKKPSGAERQSEAASVRRIGDAWMLAWILPAAIGIGYLIGYGLDHLFHTYPWCTIVFSAFGVAAGFKEVITIALRVGREEDEAARRLRGGR
jgi:ATP synthase protein I